MTRASSSRSAAELAWLGALLLIVIVLRTLSLGADPMPELDYGFISDTGTWWKNPRLHAVWGVWMVDDGNYGIMTAPAYTVVMRAAFALLGVGYAQANAVSALSGVLIVLLVYMMMRREYGAVPSLLGAALVGLNVLMIAYNRSAYPESFQLMTMTATVAAILASPGRPWLAGLGGFAAAIVLLSKPPGIVLAPIATATFLALMAMDRIRGERRFEWRGVLAYAAVAAAVLAVVGVVYLRPYAQDVWTHFRIQMADGAFLGATVKDRVQLFGTPMGFRLNEFFKLHSYLLVIVGIFAAARIARVVRIELTTVEIAAWIWLVLGFGIMSLQTYQQDRRFLFLIPPMAMLSAIALAHAFEIGESAWTSGRARRWGLAGAAGVLTLVVFFYLVPYGVYKVIGAGRLLGMELEYGVAGGILLSGAAVGAAIVAALWAPRLAWRGNTRAQLALAAIPLLYVVVRSVPEVVGRDRGLEKVSRTLDRISADWPQEDRVAAGWPAGTLTLGSRVLPVNHQTKGLRTVERYRPQLEVYAVRPRIELKQREDWAVPGRPQKVDCGEMPIWVDAMGRPRLIVHIFVEPDRLAACQAVVRTQDSSSGTNVGKDAD